MKIKLDDFKQNMIGKKVAVLGIGISNTPLIKFLSKLGVRVTAFDKSDERSIEDRLMELKKYDVEFSLGANYLEALKGFDVIFKTPIVRPDIPELVAEKERGAIITSEMEIFLELCPATVFGVTGSDGKTTTTTIIYKMLKEQGYKCWLGGNIGTPLLDKIEDILPTDKVIVELSSFQLMTMKTSPNIAVVTNLSPNHLDVHKSMEEYVDAKKNIFKYQSADDSVVFNYDDEICRQYADENVSSTFFFSRMNTIPTGVFIEDDTIVMRRNEKTNIIMKVNDIILPGQHNIENYLAAIMATSDYVSPETMKKVAMTFTGVEHRNEFVRSVSGVSFYNDSIGSSPTRTKASIYSFDQKIILIAGGYDKKIPYDMLGEVIVEKVKALVVMGETGPKILEALNAVIEKSQEDIPVFQANNMDDAVNKAFALAKPGDIILLSPASASFDMYRNFEERGNDFKNIVGKLEGK